MSSQPICAGSFQVAEGRGKAVVSPGMRTGTQRFSVLGGAVVAPVNADQCRNCLLIERLSGEAYVLH